MSVLQLSLFMKGQKYLGTFPIMGVKSIHVLQNIIWEYIFIILVRFL
jgi:hypothetical protein